MKWLPLLAPLTLVLGCTRPPPPQPPPAVADDGAALAAGRDALDRAGIEEVRFGVTPYVEGDLLAERYEPLLRHVGERLGVQIRLVVGTSYADMEDRIVEGTVDVAALPPYAYVRAARREPGLHAFATHVSDGSLSYGAYLIALVDGPVEELGDVRGRRVGYVDLHSTSGFLFPAQRLLEAGIHPLNDVQPVFLGGHDRVYEAVLSGEVEVGALYGGGLRSGRTRHPGGPRVRVVAKTLRIPCDAYVARDGLPEAAATAFGLALEQISTRDARGRALLDPGLQINGFLPVDDAHYDVVREVDEAVRRAVPEL